jgi:hypothetical protein
VAALDELWDEPAADGSRRAGDEDLHIHGLPASQFP